MRQRHPDYCGGGRRRRGVFAFLFAITVFVVVCVHSAPNAIKEKLAQTSSILGLRLISLKSNEFGLYGFGAASAFLQMVVDIAIRICQTQGRYRCWKVPPESSTALTVTAFHSRKPNLIVLDLASTSGSVFFREATSLHLVHEQKEVISDEVLVLRSYYLFRLVFWSVRVSL